ncbi:MAG: maltose ABC transporter permease MalF [Alphaproteobacteria bacterium]|nr:maltose ABC transporter permease MalF [Alphaproteobacteria bacterium]
MSSIAKKTIFYIILKALGLSILCLSALYMVWNFYLAGEPLFAIGMFVLATIAAVIFSFRRFYTWRFIYPGIAAIAVFIVLPVVYTSSVGFTNFSARNLLTFERVQKYHLQKTVEVDGSQRPFNLTTELQIYFPKSDDRAALITSTITTAINGQLTATLYANNPPEALPIKAIIQNRAALQALTIALPDGGFLVVDGLRNFAQISPQYTKTTDGVLTATDGTQLVADQDVGFFRDSNGDIVSPGWSVGVGWQNFIKIATNEGISAPMMQIFLWTCIFAFLSMVFTFSLGTGLAVLLDWKHLKGRGIYRVLLILPYAVPSFISILVFKGLFNQNFGEINLILSQLLGIKPEWFTSPLLAKTMLLIVNTWLGFPYWMLLAGGFIQAIPQDQYKAAALEGSGPIRNFFKITLPQILTPSVPLLIASFAFNFNNIVLILLLTSGGPDIAGTIIPAGSTDLLGSFTYRIAFQDSGQDFGLAGAISTLIFILTGFIAYVNFRFMQRLAAKTGAATS